MRFLSVLLVLLLAIGVFAQDEMPDITTDRPDQTESSSTVPKKTLQIEMGFALQGDKANTENSLNYSLFNTLLRYGVFDNFELRLGMAYDRADITYKQLDSDSLFQGVTPLVAGTKVYITEQRGGIPEMSLLAMFTIPGTGSSSFEQINLASDLRLAMGWQLSDRFSAGANLGLYWNGINPAGAGFYSAVLGISIADWMGAFAEVYGYLPKGLTPDHRVDAGFTFPVRKNLQLDLSGGLGLSERSPDYFVSTGFSWRIPR
jgi:hypothetical protein